MLLHGSSATRASRCTIHFRNHVQNQRRSSQRMVSVMMAFRILIPRSHHFLEPRINNQNLLVSTSSKTAAENNTGMMAAADRQSNITQLFLLLAVPTRRPPGESSLLHRRRGRMHFCIRKLLHWKKIERDITDRSYLILCAQESLHHSFQFPVTPPELSFHLILDNETL